MQLEVKIFCDNCCRALNANGYSYSTAIYSLRTVALSITHALHWSENLFVLRALRVSSERVKKWGSTSSSSYSFIESCQNATKHMNETTKIVR